MRPRLALVLVLLFAFGSMRSLAQAPLPEERFCQWLGEKELGQFADALGRGGFYPIHAEGRLHKGRREFRIAFDRHPQGVRWGYCWFFNMDEGSYRQWREKRLSQGYTEIAHQEFIGEDSQPHHQVVSRKIDRP
jgi:hypothetical protein